ncbi:TetR/AcrR family transcriptional regulator [Kitasatospora sp. NPDC058965]|uniref:TetR/AcrR family transcriptional regulator n=1 Tax=Kitasatospora sp. NPDC058965 TaxID=3346682 RepID=UPI0036D12FDC
MTSLPGRAGTKGVPRAERERQVLAAATEEFGRHGYEATTVAAVAARVGVTKPLLHQYFGSKQDLYLACLEPVGELLLGAVRAAMTEPAGAAPAAPLRVLHALFTALDGQREAWFVLYDPSLPPGSEATRRADHYRDAIDRLAATGTADLLLATGAGGADARGEGGPDEGAPGAAASAAAVSAAGAPAAGAADPGAPGVDALDADALKYAWRGLCTALVRWFIAHPDQSPAAMTRRCARILAAARSLAPDGVFAMPDDPSGAPDGASAAPEDPVAAPGSSGPAGAR